MFAVKSTYSIKTPDGNVIPFYVAGDSVYFKDTDIANEIYGSIFAVFATDVFDNYDGYFVKASRIHSKLYGDPNRFKNLTFWREVFNQDYSKVVAEVRAQNFLQDFAYIDLPREWDRLNVDFLLNDLHTRASDWIEKCYKSLQILATNDKQKEDARRVFDEAWGILKAREKDATAVNRPTVHETLTKFGLTDDDLIHAILDVHETKFANEQARRKAEFDNQHDELESELRRLLE